MTKATKSALDTYVSYISSLEGVLLVYLFGSHAYGTPNDGSDIDLMVVIEDSLDVIKIAMKIQIGLANRFVPLDVLVNRETMFYEAAENITLQAQIKNEGILLYERQ